MKDFCLYTDLYEITMAQGYFLEGKAESPASFTMYFRKLPFKGGYSIFCGSDTLLELIEGYQFDNEDIEYLASIDAPGGGKLFKAEFLEYLRNLKMSVSISAPAEGSLVFPYEPCLRIDGPILQCQLLEAGLLNCINFQTLAATKAMRISTAADGRACAEFGLRRAQGTGSMWAARASYVGGFASTSNVAAGKKFGIPVSGTHAHSWVMSHGSEIESFRKYAEYFPTNSTLLIDTYSVIEGAENAIKVAKEMEARGERLSAVRIDSGDLTWESRRVRKMLDDAGLDYVGIVLSNDLDEYTISSILREGAQVNAFGVGTKFACCYDQPTLGGVYKLNAYVNDAGEWQDTMKISESPEKTTIPGILNVKRHYDENGYLAGDMVFDERDENLQCEIIDPLNRIKSKKLCGLESEILLQPIMKDGKRTSTWSVQDARATAKASLDKLDYTRKRMLNPHIYPVGIELGLSERRDAMIKEALHN